MKRLFAPLVALSLFTLFSLTGCGGSSLPDTSPRAMAALSQNADSRGIQVTWSPQYVASERYTVVEYHVVRQSVENQYDRVLVGVASPSQTTVTDTTQERELDFHAATPLALVQSTATATGLVPGTYTYSVDTLYRDNTVDALYHGKATTRKDPGYHGAIIYSYSYAIKETNPIRFE